MSAPKNIAGILIIDFGSQYTQLIARRLRECNLYCIILSAESNPKNWPTAIKGIVLSGSGNSVSQKNLPKTIDQYIWQNNVPVLGICYGMQLMVDIHQGVIQKTNHHEYGLANVQLHNTHPLFENIAPPSINTWMSHAESVTKLPSGFEIIAKSNNQVVAAIAHAKKAYYGLQFHPEVTHTEYGKQILDNFAHLICGCEKNWNPPHVIEQATQQIQQTVGQQKVLLALSGGVDSSVAALLLHRAIGEKLTCVFINNGLLRYREAEHLIEYFNQQAIHIIPLDAKVQFFKQLEGIKEPESKRKMIGHTFIEVFKQFSKTHADQFTYLAQGTIYPDIIESAGTHTPSAKTIKSHHNVGGLPKDMPFKLLEPLRMLFKDEVRAIGKLLGLDPSILHKHPFPGPGLAVRISGEVTSKKCQILQKADHIFIQALKDTSHCLKTQQAFAVLTNTKSVGVTGDDRRWGYVVALRAIETRDFMTATACELPYSIIKAVARDIINTLPEVSRVVYDISDKPPATIEWE